MSLQKLYTKCCKQQEWTLKSCSKGQQVHPKTTIAILSNLLQDCPSVPPFVFTLSCIPSLNILSSYFWWLGPLFEFWEISWHNGNKNKVPDHHQVKSLWYFSDCHGLTTRELANITIDRLVTLTGVPNDGFLLKALKTLFRLSRVLLDL